MIVFAIFLAYLIGSIPIALLAGRYFCGVDIREHGSGNMGASNAFRVLGRNLGIAVLVLDILKGYIAVALVPGLFGLAASPVQQILLAIAAVLGHVFTVFAGFKGGKGVATAVGVFLALATYEMLIVLVIAGLIIAFTGYISLASVSGAVLLPFLLYFFQRPTVIVFACVALSVLILIRHQSNILRLINGTERQITDSANGLDDGDPVG